MQDSTNGPNLRFLLGAHLCFSIITAEIFSEITLLFFKDTYFWYMFVGFSLYLSGSIPSVLFKKMSGDSIRKIANDLGMLAIVIGSVIIASSAPPPQTMLDFIFVLVLVAYGFFGNKKHLHSSSQQ